MAEALGRRTTGGPNTLRHVEQSLQVVAALDLPVARKLSILGVLDDFTIGHAVRDLALRERLGASDVADLNEARARQIEQISGDEYPRLAELAAADPFAGVDPRALSEAQFEAGLEWLLTGIAASIASPP
jgi:hypothetical protein